MAPVVICPQTFLEFGVGSVRLCQTFEDKDSENTGFICDSPLKDRILKKSAHRMKCQHTLFKFKHKLSSHISVRSFLISFFNYLMKIIDLRPGAWTRWDAKYFAFRKSHLRNFPTERRDLHLRNKRCIKENYQKMYDPSRRGLLSRLKAR